MKIRQALISLNESTRERPKARQHGHPGITVARGDIRSAKFDLVLLDINIAG